MTLATGLTVVVLMTATHAWGRRARGGLQVVLTVLQMVPLLLVAGCSVGLPRASEQGWGSKQPFLWASGFLAVLWAYDGWYNLTILTGHVGRPERTVRRALVGGVLLVTALYLALNALVVFKVERHALGLVDALPFATMLQTAGFPGLDLGLRWALSLALLGTLNGVLVCGPRMLEAGDLAGPTASSSTWMFSAWCLGLMCLFGGLPSTVSLFDLLSDFTVVVVTALSGLTVSCLFHLRRFGSSYSRWDALAASVFLLLDLALALRLAWERPGLAVAGTCSVLLGGTLLTWRAQRRGRDSR